MIESPQDITLLLKELPLQGKSAYDQLLPLVYGELRRIADGRLQHEADAHTLQPTALVHEAYLKLVDQVQASYESRVHFLKVASTVMRRILIDHARTRRRGKRGGGRERVELTDGALVGDGADGSLDLVALDDALHRLQGLDPRKVEIAEMRYFAGMTVQETADALGVSAATVKRGWEMARLWLARELSADPADDA